MVDPRSDFIQHSVRILCGDAATGDTAQFYVPRFFLHVQLTTELGDFAVYLDTAPGRDKPVLLRGVAFQVKQNFECRSHNSII